MWKPKPEFCFFLPQSATPASTCTTRAVWETVQQVSPQAPAPFTSPTTRWRPSSVPPACPATPSATPAAARALRTASPAILTATWTPPAAPVCTRTTSSASLPKAGCSRHKAPAHLSNCTGSSHLTCLRPWPCSAVPSSWLHLWPCSASCRYTRVSRTNCCPPKPGRGLAYWLGLVSTAPQWPTRASRAFGGRTRAILSLRMRNSGSAMRGLPSSKHKVLFNPFLPMFLPSLASSALLSLFVVFSFWGSSEHISLLGVLVVFRTCRSYMSHDSPGCWPLSVPQHGKLPITSDGDEPMVARLSRNYNKHDYHLVSSSCLLRF